MASRRIGIIMHGITGRMGYNQHLVRSIVAIRDQGGVLLSNGDRAMPDPILVGRNMEKVPRCGTSWHQASRERYRVRPRQSRGHDLLRRRLNPDARRSADTSDRGREAHLLREAALETLEESLSLARLARARGVKSGVVQDKLYLPVSARFAC